MSLDFDEVKIQAQQLAEAIRRSGFNPTYIVGLARGGWIPARLLSDCLGVKKLLSFGVTYADSTRSQLTAYSLPEPFPKADKVLLVEDCLESGKSLELAVELFRAEGNTVRSACFFITKKTVLCLIITTSASRYHQSFLGSFRFSNAMFLQAAIDEASLDEARTKIGRLSSIVDIDFFEVGNPLILNYGTAAVGFFSAFVAREKIYADLKISDFPSLIIPVYAATGVARISLHCSMKDGAMKEALEICKRKQITPLISTLGYPLECLEQRVGVLLNLGLRYIICHGSGIALEDAFSDLNQRLEICTRLPEARLIAAGGITDENGFQLKRFKLSGLIIGRGLRDTLNPESSS